MIAASGVSAPSLGAGFARSLLDGRLAVGFTAVSDEGRRNSGGRKHEICGAGHDGAARHAVVGGILRVLHDNEPALVAYRRQPDAAVGAAARENRADRSRAAILGERAQEEIEGHASAMPLARLCQSKRAVADRQIDPRRDDVDVIALDRHAVRRFQHRHRGMAGQKTDHHAAVRRIEVQNQDEGHAGVGRERVEQLVEGVQPPSRGARYRPPGSRRAGTCRSAPGAAEAGPLRPPARGVQSSWIFAFAHPFGTRAQGCTAQQYHRSRRRRDRFPSSLGKIVQRMT